VDNIKMDLRCDSEVWTGLTWLKIGTSGEWETVAVYCENHTEHTNTQISLRRSRCGMYRNHWAFEW
jgi:hypothetical protein